jgi:hypothetical protein
MYIVETENSIHYALYNPQLLPGHHRQSSLMTSFTSRIGMWNRREWIYKQYKCARTGTVLRSLAESQAGLATAE